VTVIQKPKCQVKWTCEVDAALIAFTDVSLKCIEVAIMLSEASDPLLEACRMGRTDIIKRISEEVQKTIQREVQDEGERGD